MSELPQPPVTKEEQRLDATINDKLPTTPEIAREGVAAFEKVARVLPEDIQPIFLKDPGVRIVFLGIGPERSLPEFIREELTPEQIALYRRVVEDTIPFLRFYDQEYSDPKKTQTYGKYTGTLNLLAAERVIRQNPTYFPFEAQDNPQSWLFTDMNAWSPSLDDPDFVQKEKRFGLLSGFPHWSVDNYRSWATIQGKIDDGDNALTEEEIDYLGLGPSDEEYSREKFIAILKKAYPAITEHELSRYLQADSTYTEHLPFSYLGFDKPKDTAFVKALDKIYEQSGIDEVVKKLVA